MNLMSFYLIYNSLHIIGGSCTSASDISSERLKMSSTLIAQYTTFVMSINMLLCPLQFVSLLLSLSLMASNPQLLSTTQRHHTLPETYIRPQHKRPQLHQVLSDRDIPIIDLSSRNRQQLIKQVSDACISHGLFQVVNHGVPTELVTKTMETAAEFFRLPAEEKMRLYSDDPAKKMRLSTSFNVRKEKVHNWRDYLRLHCHPLEEYVPDWPSNPASFREVVSNYSKEVRQLGFRLLRLISLSLDLEEDHIERELGEQEQHMAINYYPRCPEPELTYGLPAHTDPNTLTILLLDPNVAGLQILRDDRWFSIDPHPDAFVVNIGDQLQVVSNDRYKSTWHRAIVNSNSERMSIASFLCPCNSALISPTTMLTGDGTPAIYRSYTYDEYYKKFWSRNLDQERCLELFKS